uniref:Uncharacterized protein n=1 Tax=Fagus sylvatica TaxID=28930 RepID=A0A2N9IS47_FAGSY
MQHIAGKLSTSSFQRYEVCMNRSSDERVMAPGSRGIGAVFVHFSGEDSDQTGDAFGEPRVPRRSWSRYLSNAPGLVDQLVASRKDSAREGGCPGGKMRFPPSAFFFKSCPSSGFAEIRAWTCEIWPPRTEATGVFLVRLRAVFRSGFRLDPIKSWRSESSTSCMNVSSFQRARASWINLLRVRKTLRASVATSVGKVPEFSAQPYFVGLFSRAWYRPCTEASLGSQDMILRTEAVGMFLMPREWSGSGQFDSAFGLVNSQVKPWSNLVNLGRIWSKLSKLWEMYPGPRFEGFWARWTLVGLGTARSNLGQTSVNPGQTWSTLVKPWEMCPGPSSLGVFDATRLRWIMRAGSGSPRLACRHPRKSRG